MFGKLKYLMILILLILLIPTVTAIHYDRLENENINTTINETHINFNNEYLNESLEHIDFFVPAELQDQLDTVTPCDPNLMECQGVGGRFHVLNDWTNEYNDKFYIQTDYIFKLEEEHWNPGNNIPEGFGWTRINQEILINYDKDNIGLHEILESGIQLTDNRSIQINLKSHYEILIIEYTFINDGEVVGTFEDVFKGEKPELLPITSQINKYRPEQEYKDRFLTTLDNQYREEFIANVTIAYPNTTQLWKVEFGNYTEIENRYSQVVQKANNIGANNTLLDTTDGYTIKTYSVLVSKNETSILKYYVDSELGEFNNLRMWIEGSFAGGDGTSSDPYQISNCSNLNETRNNLSSSFELINDIDCSDTINWNDDEGWIPIGGYFSGTFDGNGYVIKDLFMNASTSNSGSWGLFSKLRGTVKNLGVEDAYMEIREIPDTYRGAGIIAGFNDGVIRNCYTTGNIIQTSGCTNVYLGGITGWSYGDFYNSYSTANVTTTCSSGVLGIAGFLGNAQNTPTIEDSYSIGKITGPSSGGFISTTGSSCPYVYSYDGEQYNFDSEAITRYILPELKGSELSRLYTLQPDNGEYKLQIREELSETSYIDKVELLRIKNINNTDIYAGIGTNIHTISDYIEPNYVIDDTGKNISLVKDGKVWNDEDYTGINYTDEDGDGWADSNETEDLYKYLELEFDKPDNQSFAKIHFGTQELQPQDYIWLNFMKIANDEEKLQDWLYDGTIENFFYNTGWANLKIMVWNGTEWVKKGHVNEFARQKISNVIYELNISDINTDNLKIRFTTLPNMAGIEYVYMDYTENEDLEIERIQPNQDILKHIDSNESILNNGDLIDITFNTTGYDDSESYTYLLNMTGYYVGDEQDIIDITLEEIEKSFEYPYTSKIWGYKIWSTFYQSSYWNTETSNQSTSAIALPRNTTEMTYPYQNSTYDNWNSTIWNMTDHNIVCDYNGECGYPALYYQEEEIITDTCTYSGSGNWTIDLTDSCVINTDYDLGTNQIILNNTGSVTFNSRINVTDFPDPANNQNIYIDSNAYMLIS